MAGPRQSPAQRAAAFFSLWNLPDQSEPDTVAAVGFFEAVARRGAHQRRGCKPRPAPQVMLGTVTIGEPRRAIGRRTAIVRMPAILDPLENIPQHVVQAECVRLEGADWSCVYIPVTAGVDLPSRVLLGGRLVRDVCIGTGSLQVILPWTGTRKTGARRISPFGLGGEPILLAGLLRQPRGEFPRVPP